MHIHSSIHSVIPYPFIHSAAFFILIYASFCSFILVIYSFLRSTVLSFILYTCSSFPSIHCPFINFVYVFILSFDPLSFHSFCIRVHPFLRSIVLSFILYTCSSFPSIHYIPFKYSLFHTLISYSLIYPPHFSYMIYINIAYISYMIYINIAYISYMRYINIAYISPEDCL